MTTADWTKVKEAWGQPYKSIEIEADGYKLQLLTTMWNMKVYMLVYVNGYLEGKNFLKHNGQWSDIATRFHRSSYKSFWKAKQIKEIEKALGKKYAKEHGYYDKHESKHPDWQSFTSFKRHLLKHNKTISLI